MIRDLAKRGADVGCRVEELNNGERDKRSMNISAKHRVVGQKERGLEEGGGGLTWEKKVEMTVGVVAQATEKVLKGMLYSTLFGSSV